MNPLQGTKYKTRRLPAFHDNQGRRVTVRVELSSGNLIFSRSSRVILKASLAQLFILGSAPEEFRQALAWGEASAASIACSMQTVESAQRDLDESAKLVLKKTGDAARAFIQAYQCVLPFVGSIATKVPQ